MDSIKTEELTKVYRRGDEPAVAGMSLRVKKGELFGFLGPNGAGKTTTIRILMTLLKPSHGRAWLNNCDVQLEPIQALSSVGYTPEQPGFYASLTGEQHLRYWGRLYGLKRSTLDPGIRRLLERVGLGKAATTKAKAYSLGMRRRLALAGALLPDPELLILDEPSLGLDPQGLAFVRSLLLDLKHEGRTVFLSSHILAEVERICTQVGVLHRGRLLRVDTPKAIALSFGGGRVGLEVSTQGISPTVVESLRRIDGVTRVDVQGPVVKMFGQLEDNEVAEVQRILVNAGVGVLGVRSIETDLEEAFLSLTRDQS